MPTATPLHIRLDPAVQRKLKVNAVTLGITQGEYLARLMQLHELCRERTDAGHTVDSLHLLELGLLME